jgi:hypothetical protein
VHNLATETKLIKSRVAYASAGQLTIYHTKYIERENEC